MEYELANQLHNLMKRNIVEFTFRKKDGTIRHARGTRNLNIASVALGYAVRIPKGEEQPNSYYDLDKDGWRSYIPANVMSIDRIVPMPSISEMVREVYGNEEPKNEGRKEVGVGIGVGGGFGVGIGGGSESKPKDKGNGEIPFGTAIGGGIPIGFGIGGGVSKEEIRRTMDAIGKDIELPNGKELEKLARAIGVPNGKDKPIVVGAPIHQPNGIAVPIEGVGGEQITIDDFARLIAKYAVEALIDRLKG